MDEIIMKAMEWLKPGTEFYLRLVDVTNNPVGVAISCKVVKLLETGRPWPVVLAHVGRTEEVTLLHMASDEIGGAQVVTAIGVCGSDAEMDYGYPEAMLSDEWAGALLVVLD